MLGSRVGASARASHDRQGNGDLAAEHVVDLGCIISDLVGAYAVEADVHEVDYRAEPRCSGPDTGTDEAGLRDGCIAHPAAPELADKSLGQPHRAAPGVLLVVPVAATGNVLAHDDDVLVAFHLLLDSLVDCLYIRDLSYGFSYHDLFSLQAI